MERTIETPENVQPQRGRPEHKAELFSMASFLNLQKLIFTGSPLSDVLNNIAQLVESQTKGMFCTIWLPDEDGKELHCAAAPSLPGFCAAWGPWLFVRKGHPAERLSIGESRCM